MDEFQFGDFWRFSVTEGVDIVEQLDAGARIAQRILGSAGVHNLSDSIDAEEDGRFPVGSELQLANQLFKQAHYGLMRLDCALRNIVDGESTDTLSDEKRAKIGGLQLLLEAVFLAGYQRAVLETSLRRRDRLDSLLGAAATGEKQRASTPEARRGRRKQADRTQLEEWGKIVLQVAKEARAQDPEISKSKIYKRTQDTWQDRTSRPNKLPEKESVVRFLTKYGF